MNNSSFYTKIWVPKTNTSCKNYFKSIISNIISLVYMETKPIMITPTTKFAISNFGMESSCVDSILKLDHANSKPKSSKSTPSNFRVESSMKYSKPKSFLPNSTLEFIVESKFPTALLERCRFSGMLTFRLVSTKI